MRTDIIEYLEKEVRARCESESNFFGMGCYCHIRAVVKNAVELAGIYGADEEVVTIAAWLHDIASVTDYRLYEEHHLHGARMAGEILDRFDYSKEKTELVQKCIQNHRGSRLMEKTTAEEQCIADGDSVSHFDSIPSLFYLAYINRKLSIEEGTAFVKGKLKRSYQKLSPQGKELYQEKYSHAMELLSCEDGF